MCIIRADADTTASTSTDTKGNIMEATQPGPVVVHITASNVARMLAGQTLPAGAAVIGWARRAHDALREPLVRLANGTYVTMLAGSMRTLDQRSVQDTVDREMDLVSYPSPI